MKVNIYMTYIIEIIFLFCVTQNIIVAWDLAFYFIKSTVENKKEAPYWCDLVGCVPACEPKGHWFNTQSGHMPGLWARSFVERV